MVALPPILIVDDDADDIFILKRLLAKANITHKVVSFEDARAAFAYLQAEIAAGDKIYYPCVAFTDLNMPSRTE
jgi:CheY-like chemotaxis protein